MFFQLLFCDELNGHSKFQYKWQQIYHFSFKDGNFWVTFLTEMSVSKAISKVLLTKNDLFSKCMMS